MREQNHFEKRKQKKFPVVLKDVLVSVGAIIARYGVNAVLPTVTFKPSVEKQSDNQERFSSLQEAVQALDAYYKELGSPWLNKDIVPYTEANYQHINSLRQHILDAYLRENPQLTARLHDSIGNLHLIADRSKSRHNIYGNPEMVDELGVYEGSRKNNNESGPHIFDLTIFRAGESFEYKIASATIRF
jgi:hypothetical protein